MPVTATHAPWISSSIPVKAELQSGGRVLVLKSALYNQATHRWQDLRIERSGWGKWFRGSLQAVTPEEIERIRKTYEIVLKTIGMQPGETPIASDRQSTHFTQKGAKGSLEKKISYAHREGFPDTLLAADDARFFGQTDMTVHDAVVAGILAPLKLSGAIAQGVDVVQRPGKIKPEKVAAVMPPKAPETEDVLEEIALLPPVPKSNVGSKGFTKADRKCFEKRMDNPHHIEMEYDLLSAEERKQRLIQYLDRVSPVPMLLSAMIANQAPSNMDPDLFARLRGSLGRLSVQKSLAKLAALEAQTTCDAKNREERNRLRMSLAKLLRGKKLKDVCKEWTSALKDNTVDRYAEELLAHWFRAAYHYLDTHSTLDDDVIQRRALELQNRDDRLSEEQSRQMAREEFLRDLAADYLVWLNDATTVAVSENSAHKVSDNGLIESVQQTKLKPFWW